VALTLGVLLPACAAEGPDVQSADIGRVVLSDDSGPLPPDGYTSGLTFTCCCYCVGAYLGQSVNIAKTSWAFEFGSDVCLPNCFDKIRSQLGVENLNPICTKRYEGYRCG
jgi:hypothetical protein